MSPTRRHQRKHRETGPPGPIAFVFSSGGGRAAAQVGMMTALIEAGVVPDLLVGSSFGSINAAAYAAVSRNGYESVTEDLQHLWSRIGEDSVFATPGTSLARRLTVSRRGKTNREMREIVAEVIPDKPLFSLHTPFIPIATDLTTGQSFPISEASTLDAALASSAMPIFLNPITIDDTILIDGGFAQCAPIRTALGNGAGSIIILDAAASTVPQEELKDFRWWEIAATAYDHVLRGQVGHDLPHVAKQVPVIALTTEYGNVFDFSNSEGMYEAGLECAQDVLPRLDEMTKPGLYNVPIGFETYPPVAALAR